jgi:hypothetical protein
MAAGRDARALAAPPLVTQIGFQPALCAKGRHPHPVPLSLSEPSEGEGALLEAFAPEGERAGRGGAQDTGHVFVNKRARALGGGLCPPSEASPPKQIAPAEPGLGAEHQLRIATLRRLPPVTPTGF